MLHVGHRQFDFRTSLRGMAVPLLLLLATVNAMAQMATTTPKVRAVPTGLASDNERMISYRHQEHMWQTTDGGLHLMVNRGTLGPWIGLALFSSFDGGVSWSFQRTFENTDEMSSADGFIKANDLTLAYQTADGNIVYTRHRYDPDTRTWSALLTETAYASATLGAINPAIAVDERGTTWCSFVARDRVTNDVNVRVIARVAGGATWYDPGLVFGPTDHRSIERSARPVPIPDGMAMVFTVREKTYWATRSNALSTDAAWAVNLLFAGTPVPSYQDPYASHFGVVGDPAGNVHFVINEDYDVLYLKWNAATGLWSTPKQVDDARNVVYMQVGLSNGKLVVAFSVQRGRGLVVVSPDLGETFGPWVETVLTPAVPGANFNTARVEMPAVSQGNLSLLQQYAIYGTQTLMAWKIPGP